MVVVVSLNKYSDYIVYDNIIILTLTFFFFLHSIQTTASQDLRIYTYR